MREYLVEVTSGRELLYRTSVALRAAMRSGENSPDSRIFHRTASTWVPITEHPEYRRFLTDGHRPAGLDPPAVERAAPPDITGARGFFGGLAGFGTWLVRWLKYSSASGRSSRNVPRAPTQGPRRRASSPTTPGAHQAERDTSVPARDRWTFFP
jgi:hypothetical protein